jgi:membrane protein YqaA with SNARE-associated domain
MTRFLSWAVSWWGVFVLGAIDSSMVFFVPLGIDAIVVYLAARNTGAAWLYPFLATAGSVCGAAFTFWIGHHIGDQGLERRMPHARLERLRRRVHDGGAAALAVPALLPPPFPLTPFVLTCGALKVNRWVFFSVFAAARFARFGSEAALATAYGSRVLKVLQSEAFRVVVLGFVGLAVVGTVTSAWLLWRGTHRSAAPASA